MSTTLYRKYRPATFSEVIGQKHVVQTLKNSIKNGRIGQAYLFAGPRGTGKTSIARIFAKAINCTSLKSSEPCLKCAACKIIGENRALDIIEIDAASNTGVDNIRELRETVKLPPSSLKYKVYIIDEVHMLSGGAFNALLKTLEEPPEHVVFILATTEVHKIPETILSRVQRFDFTRLTLEEIMQRLEEIAKLEKVKIDPEALEIIASSSEGGMRNAESLLGQVIALEDKKITAKEVQFILGSVSDKVTSEFAGLIFQGNFPEAMEKIIELKEAGVDFKNFGKSLLNHLRVMLVIKLNPDLGKKLSYEITKEQLGGVTELLKNIEVEAILRLISSIQKNSDLFKSSPIPHLFLEISVAEMFLETSPKTKISAPPEVDFKITKKSEPAIEEKQAQAIPEPDAAASRPLAPKGDIDQSDLDRVITNWPDIIDELKSYNHSLSSVLKMTQPSLLDANYLILKTKYSFYKDKMVEMQNKLTIEQAIDKITGVKLRMKVLTETEFKAEYPDFKEKKSLLQDAMDIFGGKIVKG
ncbi:MAG: DNA polymerase III subunit gamma/tau [Parcubacteria group bacterium]|jgi:DNA polymerase-3 subunit gamma/tau